MTATLATERDLAALGFAAEMWAVRRDRLLHLLGGDQPISAERGRQVVERWERAGLATRRRLIWGQPGWVWITRRGLRTVGIDLPFREPSLTMLRHIDAVVATRLWIERNWGGEGWTGERRLYRARVGNEHVPDGLWWSDGEAVAVEVELTLKSRDRLTHIVADNLQRYRRVLYVAGTPAIEHAVAATATLLGATDRVRVRPFGETQP